MKTVIKHAPAKINLFLHITGKRPDGYHNLQTVFRLIDLYDTLTFTRSSQLIGNTNTVVTLNKDPSITENIEQNLIVKAARRLLAYVRQHHMLSEGQIQALPIIDIQLDKQIPMGAGLGGGSSDCATTLMTLNDMWQLGLSNVQLREIGATLGADVPIFIYGQDAIAEGIGEILTPIQLAPQRILLLMPKAHINTAQLFAHPALRRDCPAFPHEFIYSHESDFTNQLTSEFSNVFEPVVRDLSHEVDSALSHLAKLAENTQTTPRMTGSGSCVFLPLSNHVDEETIAQWQQQAPCPSRVVRTFHEQFNTGYLYER